MKESVITLCKRVYTYDTYGNQEETLVETDVFADVSSISQQEFFSANNVGLKPRFKFMVFEGDYDGQDLVKYEGITYMVYRSFINDAKEKIELYCEERLSHVEDSSTGTTELSNN